MVTPRKDEAELEGSPFPSVTKPLRPFVDFAAHSLSLGFKETPKTVFAGIRTPKTTLFGLLGSLA